MKTVFNYILSAILSGMMCFLSYGQAQAQNQVTYGYDASGNRIKRVIVLPSKSPSPPAETEMETEAKTETETEAEPKTEEQVEPKIFSEMLKDFSVRIYPNPTKGDLTVEIQSLPDENTATLRLYSMSGNLILQRTGVRNIETLNISNQAAGIYILKITSGDSSTEWKIIKQ